MVESFLLLCLITIVILTILRGKPVVLDNPVIIQRAGQYHITLAPQLNRAQAFIESIATQFPLASSVEFSAQYFEVRDPKVFAQGANFYLLAIALRGGMLYFQAINPQPVLHDADSHFEAVRKFSDTVLALHPLAGLSDEQSIKNLESAIESAAQYLKIDVKPLRSAD